MIQKGPGTMEEEIDECPECWGVGCDWCDAEEADEEYERSLDSWHDEWERDTFGDN